jgi:mannose-6-phosphate isomerase-like protein (cupin superfamily)
MAKAYVKNVYDCTPAAPLRHLNAHAWAMGVPATMGTSGADITFNFFSICEIRFGGAAILDNHKDADHCYFILSGKGYSFIKGKRYEYKPNDVMWIPGNCDHEMYPIGVETLRFLVTLPPKDFNQTEPFIRNISEVSPVVPPKHVDASAYPIVTPKNGGSNTIEFHVTEIRPGGRADADVHEESDHMYFFISGRGYTICDGEKLEFGPNDALYIPKGVKHEMAVVGEETLRMAVTFAPARMAMRG